MSENSSKENNSKGGLLGVGIWLAGFVTFFLWGPALWVLAFVVTFGSLIAGAFLLIRSHSSGDQERQVVNEEIEAMASDASFDVSEQIIFWDKIMFTKGVGTQLEGREQEISEIHRRLVNVRGEIAAAESPQHRLEAVLAADAVLATARLLR
ncbi:hypothetical protein [Corynebacterium sp. A21]|uniref:hypothetical protein n=1 Tax=Corynebacterium sp. A21 TaxID=3457318 RepID=UPI003FD6C02F